MNGVRESKTSTNKWEPLDIWLEQGSNHSSSAVDVYALARTALELLMVALPRTPLEDLHDQITPACTKGSNERCATYIG